MTIPINYSGCSAYAELEEDRREGDTDCETKRPKKKDDVQK